MRQSAPMFGPWFAIAVQGDGVVAAVVTNDTVVANAVGFRVDPSFSGSDSSILRNSLFWNNGDDLDGVSVTQVRDCVDPTSEPMKPEIPG